MSLTPQQTTSKPQNQDITFRLYNLMQECNPQKLGLYGECLARHWLEAGGYLVDVSKGCDLIAANTDSGELYRIEVKTARRASDRRFHFTLTKQGHTNHKLSDVLVLICINYRYRVVPFVVPLGVVADQHQVTIPSDPIAYQGKFSAYRQAEKALRLP